MPEVERITFYLFVITIVKFTQGQMEQLDQLNFNNETIRDPLQILIVDRKEIRQDNSFKGRMTKGWSEIQGTHFDTLDLPDCQAYIQDGVMVDGKSNSTNHVLQLELMADTE